MAGLFDEEAEQTVTMDEYIEGIEAQELEADLVLGGDEGKECTYANRYMKRQAIFSCLTCVPSGNAGVCTACSLSCHDGHEVVELWTKRKFRCDCGNSKFGEFSCKLLPTKDPENGDNSYNHNFKGAYCTCGRPYPDPEAEEQVEMIQCCICEDWFHEDHLGLDSVDKIPKDEDGEPTYDEFICKECSLTCSFLDLYPKSIWATSKLKDMPTPNNKEEQKEGKPSCLLESEDMSVSDKVINCSSDHPGSEIVSNDQNISNGENSENTDNSTGLAKSMAEAEDSRLKCTLEVDINTITLESGEKKPMFLIKSWRDLLCRCESCCKFYNMKGIDYLVDKEDSLQEYEKIAKERREEKLQQEEGAAMNFINALGHVQKMEILNGIADMKNELQTFLQSVGTSRTITSDDVRSIFENLAKKRRFQ